MKSLLTASETEHSKPEWFVLKCISVVSLLCMSFTATYFFFEQISLLLIFVKNFYTIIPLFIFNNNVLRQFNWTAPPPKKSPQKLKEVQLNFIKAKMYFCYLLFLLLFVSVWLGYLFCSVLIGWFPSSFFLPTGLMFDSLLSTKWRYFVVLHLNIQNPLLLHFWSLKMYI